ncbi:MAG TPA: hypothetical protein VE733_11050, partial [Streptosporangiaceae bacterium]|nr:hypothetical protein [Streptosporangiaceae bacterium]
MSGTVSQGRATDQHAEAAEAGGPLWRGRGRWVAAGLAVVVVVAGVAAAWYAGVLRSHDSPGGGAGGSAYPAATAMVTQQDLSSQTSVNATLGYAGSYTVTGKGSGTLTWLPSPGQVIKQGQALY